MGYILVLSCFCLPAWHGDEHASFSFNDFDIVDDETIIESHRHIRLQLAFTAYSADADIGNLHTANLLADRCAVPKNGAGLARQSNCPPILIRVWEARKRKGAHWVESTLQQGQKRPFLVPGTPEYTKDGTSRTTQGCKIGT